MFFSLVYRLRSKHVLKVLSLWLDAKHLNLFGLVRVLGLFGRMPFIWLCLYSEVYSELRGSEIIVKIDNGLRFRDCYSNIILGTDNIKLHYSIRTTMGRSRVGP